MFQLELELELELEMQLKCESWYLTHTSKNLATDKMVVDYFGFFRYF